MSKIYVNSKGLPITKGGRVQFCPSCPCYPTPDCKDFPPPVKVLTFRSKFHEWLYYTYMPENEELKNVRKCKIDIEGYGTFDLFLAGTDSKVLKERLYDAGAENSPYDGRFYHKEGTPYPHPPPMKDYEVKKKEEEYYRETGKKLNLVKGEDYIDFNDWIKNYFSFYDILKNGEDYKDYQFMGNEAVDGAESVFQNIPYSDAYNNNQVHVSLALEVKAICLHRTIGVSGLNEEAIDPCNNKYFVQYAFYVYLYVADFRTAKIEASSSTQVYLWLSGNNFFKKNVFREKLNEPYHLTEETKIEEFAGVSFKKLSLYPEVLPFEYNGEFKKRYSADEIKSGDVQEEDWLEWYAHYGPLAGNNCEPLAVLYHWGVRNDNSDGIKFRAYSFEDNPDAVYGQYYYPPYIVKRD